MLFGIDRLVANHFQPLLGRRVGLFTNLSAVNQAMLTTYTLFARHDSIDLRAIFSPEHGLAGMAADGETVASTIDSRTGLPVYSLYGESYAPTAEMLADIDVMVCDIQDIGVRYYTFFWTISYILEACGQHSVEVMILDRPNPLGGGLDGGPLDPALSSLVGRFSIPIQHGMSLGELAQMINAHWNPTPAQLTVIPCATWQRSMQWPVTGRPFIPPSPNMPRFSTVMHYPGACLIEGTTLSEGRGTTLPFEIVGAPYLDPQALADSINAHRLEGIIARAHYFRPTASKYSGDVCGGIQLHITSNHKFRPLSAWLTILGIIRKQYPTDFAWLPAENGIQHFDRLIGDTNTRHLIDSGASFNDICLDWVTFHTEFIALRKPYLIYGE